MSKHTPGPWTVEARSNRRGQHLPPHITANGRGEIIATLGCFSTREANANLIAAAPELYGALVEAIEAIEWRLPPAGECKCSGAFECVAHSALRIARAAIAKAEGKATP